MTVASLILPLILVGFGCICLFSKRDMTLAFYRGAEGGLRACFSLLPTLALLLTSVSMLRASGATELLSACLKPLLSHVAVPSELSTLLLVRPFSGSGATALLEELLVQYGPDSFVGLCASVLSASSDTVFYILPLYLAAGGVKHGRHTLPVALLVMLLSTILSPLFCRLLLG